MMAKEILRPEPAPADRAILFICEKCGKGADFSGKDLKHQIRSLLKEEGKKGDVRVAFTSCLDICPKDGIAVGLAFVSQSTPAEFFVAKGEVETAARLLLDRCQH